jgi:hypothetical protein
MDAAVCTWNSLEGSQKAVSCFAEELKLCTDNVQGHSEQQLYIYVTSQSKFLSLW